MVAEATATFNSRAEKVMQRAPRTKSLNKGFSISDSYAYAHPLLGRTAFVFFCASEFFASLSSIDAASTWLLAQSEKIIRPGFTRQTGTLRALGKPRPNAVKFFRTAKLIALLADRVSIQSARRHR
jgi:hypothetical protein